MTVKINPYPIPSLITISLQLEPANIVLVPAKVMLCLFNNKTKKLLHDLR